MLKKETISTLSTGAGTKVVHKTDMIITIRTILKMKINLVRVGTYYNFQTVIQKLVSFMITIFHSKNYKVANNRHAINI